MAILDNTPNNKQTNTNQNQQVPNNPQNQQVPNNPQNQQAPSGWSLISSMFGSILPRGMGSDSTRKIHDKLVEIYKQANQDTEVTIVTIDRQSEPDLAFSVILVCVRKKSNLNIGVAYHVLLVEASGDRDKLLPVQVNEIPGMGPVELHRVPGDAIDSQLFTIVQKYVSLEFPGIPNYFVDGTVVPKDFDPENNHNMFDLAVNAGTASTTEIDLRLPNKSDLNLARLIQENDQLRASRSLFVDLTFGQQTAANSINELARVDAAAVIRTASRPGVTQMAGRNITSLNSGNSDVPVASVGGYVDCIWAPSDPNIGSSLFNNQQIDPNKNKQLYVARFVITTLMSRNGYTTASVLFALYSALAMDENDNWYQAFHPAHAVERNLYIHDIGALNIEANIENNPNGVGVKIDTKSDTFTLKHLGELISRLFRRGLIISLDVPEAGLSTWYLSIFREAAAGSHVAMNKVIEAANSLTDGRFSNVFQPNSPIFVGAPQRVHLGSWVDSSGTKRDIRDFDYRAIANLSGAQGQAMIRQWSDIQNSPNYTIIQRLAAERKIITSLVGNSVEFTGYANRVTFTNNFMRALGVAINSVGLNVSVKIPVSSSEYDFRRAMSSHVDAGLLVQGPDQYFRQQGGFMGGINFNNGVSRW